MAIQEGGGILPTFIEKGPSRKRPPLRPVWVRVGCEWVLYYL